MLNWDQWIKTNLPELDDEFPFCLGQNHQNRNQNRVTPKYPIENLHSQSQRLIYSYTLIHISIYIIQREREWRERKSYIRSVLERSNGGENINSDTENGRKGGHDAEALTHHQENARPRSQSGGAVRSRRRSL